MAIPNWLSLSQVSGSGDTIITITASTLQGLVERTANLVISGHTKYINVEVRQVPHNYAEDYLTFRITGGGPIVWSRTRLGDYQATPKSIQYRKNGGEWTNLFPTLAGASVNALPGDVFEFKGDNTAYCNPVTTNDGTYYLQGGTFAKTRATFIVEGNVMSLIDSTNFQQMTTLSEPYALSGLFSIDNYTYDACIGLTSAEDLILPATVLGGDHSYSNMFGGCSAMTTAPVICATTLSEYCYGGMFSNCGSLATPPSLPVTSLTRGCYSSMFAMTDLSTTYRGLTTAPTLPATTLATSCYYFMFYGCTNITTPPVLPATVMATNCYYSMFYDSGLVTAPSLPATTLAEGCYRNMFEGCTGLTTPMSSLPATNLEMVCYTGMFSGCTALTQSPVLPATTLATACYANMFNGCASLSAITCLATSFTSNQNTSNWVSGVAQSGTFTKSASMSSWPYGNNGIPVGWTVVDAT